MSDYYYTLSATSRNAAGGARYRSGANVAHDSIIEWARDECTRIGTTLEDVAAALEKLADDGRTFRAYNMTAPGAVAEFLDDATDAGIGDEAANLVRADLDGYSRSFPIGDFRAEREADAWYEAAAGRDYGYTAAYKLGQHRALICYGNNAETNYDIADASIIADPAALAEYLIGEVDDPILQAIGHAHIMGLDATGEADDYDGATYSVLIARQYYGPAEITDAARGDDGEPLVFSARADAQAWIAAADAGIYTTAHNESGRPAYKIINA